MGRKKGYKMSDEHRKAISDARKGMVFTKEHIDNMKLAWCNRVVSEETKEKMAEARRKYWKLFKIKQNNK